jgi:structure-specific recognition protein 1
MTAAKLFDDKIHKKANIGEFAGAVIASIQDLPLIIPRGYYSLEFYNTFAKLHGKTHDYKIMFKDISKVFMLTKPDGVHMVYLI